MNPSTSPDAPRVPRPHRWLLVLPFVWQVALAPWSNGVPLRPLGLPFPMFWQMLGIVATTLVIGVVYALDRRADAAAGAASGTASAHAAGHSPGADESSAGPRP